jgi:hypothetical protein
MFIVVPLIGVVVATWRSVLLVLGDGPADAERGSTVQDTASVSTRPAAALDQPAGTSSVSAS